MIWELCLVLIVVYSLVLRWKYRKLRKIHEQFPVNLKSLPVLGHALSFFGDSKDVMRTLEQIGREAVEDRDGIISVWIINKLLIIIADPLSAEVVLKACLEKDEMIMNLATNLVGTGSIIAPVPIWRARRKVLATIFGHKTLNSFVKIFIKQSLILMEKLETHVGKGNFSIFDKIANYSMDSVSETVFGVHVNSQSVPSHPFPKAFQDFCCLGAARVLKPWLYSDAVYKWCSDFPAFDRCCNTMKEFAAKIISTKRQSLTKQNNIVPHNEKLHISEHYQQNNKAKSFLDLLIEAGGEKDFSDLELQEESLVLLVAATDTSSTAASFTALLLAMYPEVQEKVYQEICEVIGESGRSIEPEDLTKLKYLDAVIKESIRMYPPVPFIVRSVDQETKLPSGVTLVPGVCAVISILSIHRNPKYWGPDANVFRPERFLEDPIKHPYAYIPFSNGPRNCLGGKFALMSVKTVFAHLIRQYRLLSRHVPGDTGENNNELPIKFEMALKHVDNFELRLQMRN